MAIRTDKVSLRIDPQTRYLGYLAALHTRISLSTLIDRGIRKVVAETVIHESDHATPLQSLTQELWAEHEADRFAKLADRLEFLLTPAQSELWERVKADQRYWKQPLSQGEVGVSDLSFKFAALREDWPTLAANSKDGE